MSGKRFIWTICWICFKGSQKRDKRGHTAALVSESGAKGDSMTIYEYGNQEASTVLIQPVGEHDFPGIEKEAAEIRKLTGMNFRLVAVKVDSWNHDLSPWNAPAVFGKEDFGDGAAELLDEILKLCTDGSRTYYLGGYSLAGLFSLWAAYQTDVFSGVAAASPSVWFPGFIDYMKQHEIRSRAVYLSLGDKEEKTRNPVMSTVSDCIREGYAWLNGQGIRCTLEWNPGNHFREPDLRTAKAFAWVMNSIDFAPDRNSKTASCDISP